MLTIPSELLATDVSSISLADTSKSDCKWYTAGESYVGNRNDASLAIDELDNFLDRCNKFPLFKGKLTKFSNVTSVVFVCELLASGDGRSPIFFNGEFCGVSKI